MKDVAKLRSEYHSKICRDIIRISTDRRNGQTYPNFADSSSASSILISVGIIKRLHYVENYQIISGQTAGELFETYTKEFVEQCFELIQHLRPGKWVYSTSQTAISGFEQYEHLAYIEEKIKQDASLSSALGGDYIIKPDIVIGRQPVSDQEINAADLIIDPEVSVANLTPLRLRNRNNPKPILHASISCKWTIRSDRSQNTRTEALNLIRNRKGALPHVVAVTAEPLPTRIAALALGTGDLDCVYHFALAELEDSILDTHNQDQYELLKMMIEGRRLRDISDLPFDLAI